jgi:hypothetical protein
MIEEMKGIRSGLSKEKSAQDISAYESTNARLLSEKRQNEHKRSNSQLNRQEEVELKSSLREKSNRNLSSIDRNHKKQITFE